LLSCAGTLKPCTALVSFTSHTEHSVFQLRKLKHKYPFNLYNLLHKAANLQYTTSQEEKIYGSKTSTATI
jgi:hypothetical protein